MLFRSGIVELNKKDIVRHKLVTRIVEAYEKEKEEKTHPDLPSEGGNSNLSKGNK